MGCANWPKAGKASLSASANAGSTLAGPKLGPDQKGLPYHGNLGRVSLKTHLLHNTRCLLSPTQQDDTQLGRPTCLTLSKEGEAHAHRGMKPYSTTSTQPQPWLWLHTHTANPTLQVCSIAVHQKHIHTLHHRGVGAACGEIQAGLKGEKAVKL